MNRLGKIYSFTGLAACGALPISFLGLLAMLVMVGCKTQIKPPDPIGITSSEGFSDLHNSVLYRLFSSGNLAGLEDAEQAVSLNSFDKVGAKFMVLSLGIPRFNMRGGETVQIGDVVDFLRRFREKVEGDYPGLEWVGNKKDLQKAMAGGKTAITFALEGSWMLEGETRWVDSLYQAGVRMVGLAHRFHNAFFLPPAEMEATVGRAPAFLHPESALSDSGKALVRRMLAAGMRIDVSHLPERAFEQVVELNAGRTPLFASHANAHALCPVARNLKDAQIKAIAETGGLIGVCFHQKLLCGGHTPPGVAEVADQLAHLIEVAGEDHVALGSDWEGLITPAEGLERLDHVPAIRAELGKRGIPKPAIEKVMWQNALGVF